MYWSVQLKKSPFIFEDMLHLNNKSRDDKIRNNNGQLCPE